MTQRTYQGLPLDSFQADALDAIERGENVIVAAPTGCGKTLIAEYAIERALGNAGERVVYTAPIKALSNQKFRDFGARYGARIGIMTGDVTINPTADAMIMTTEIFRNTIFDNPAKLAGIRYVILDEAHYLDDPERGTVWEESIIFAPPQIRFIMLSATISNLGQFASWVRKIREGGLTVVLEEKRPVPLRFFVFTGEALLDMRETGGKHFVAKGRAADGGPGGGRPKPPAPGAFGGGGRGRHGGTSAVEVEEVPFERERSGRDGFGGRGARTARAHEPGGAGGRGRGGRSPRGMSPMQRSFRMIDRIIENDHLPSIFFLFSRTLCEQMAQHCADRELLDLEEKGRLEQLWNDLAREFDLTRSEPAQRLGKLVRRGIAYHHAGMLPTLKEVVERLFTSGLVKLLFATETFAIGVNMPARSVAFETLKKFDGVKRDYMRTRDFLQMAGRAGRRGKDKEGFVYTGVDPEQERPPDLRRVMEGQVEPVESQFNLSYATLLTLWSHLGDGIYTACERSFVHFSSRGRATPFHDMIAQVKRRIQLLEDTGYIRGRALTQKGKCASLIYGFEIQAAELQAGGFLASLDAHQLAFLCVSLVYEAKREGWSVPLARHALEPVRRPARDRIDDFRRREQSYRITHETKLPEWSLARAVWEWTHGAPFESLTEWSEVSPGDLVRWFRLGIQLLRQLAKPLRFVPEDSTKFQETIREAMKLMKRGEVDAERSLRQAIQHEAGPEAAARIPREADIATEAPEGDVALDHVAHEEAAGAHVSPPSEDLDDEGADRDDRDGEAEADHDDESAGSSDAEVGFDEDLEDPEEDDGFSAGIFDEPNPAPTKAPRRVERAPKPPSAAKPRVAHKPLPLDRTASPIRSSPPEDRAARTTTPPVAAPPSAAGPASAAPRPPTGPPRPRPTDFGWLPAQEMDHEEEASLRRAPRRPIEGRSPSAPGAIERAGTDLPQLTPHGLTPIGPAVPSSRRRVSEGARGADAGAGGDRSPERRGGARGGDRPKGDGRGKRGGKGKGRRR